MPFDLIDMPSAGSSREARIESTKPASVDERTSVLMSTPPVPVLVKAPGRSIITDSRSLVMTLSFWGMAACGRVRMEMPSDSPSRVRMRVL